MKKRMAWLLSAALLCFTLFGCSGKEGASSTAQLNSAPASSEGGESSPGESSPGESSPGESTGGASQTGEELVLYTWPGLFPQDVLKDFTKETGIAVSYVEFANDEVMLGRLQAKAGDAYDVVVADDYALETAIKKELVRKLDMTKLPNAKNLDPLFQGQYFDPENEYVIPWGVAVQTIVYDPAKTGGSLTGYGDLWETLPDKSLGMVANARLMNGAALRLLGESANTDDSAAIGKAEEKLMELVPKVGLIKDDGIQDDLVSGTVSAALMYSPQVAAAMKAAEKKELDLQVVFPKEGLLYGLQGLFLPSNSLHKDAAYAFVDYLLRPEVAARCFTHMGYCSTLRDSAKELGKDYQFLALPEGTKAEDMELIQGISAEAMKAHETAWNNFKLACQG